MRALRRERPEVPLHLVGAHAGVREALLGVDEVLELGGVADEEDRRVVADQVVVAFLGIELQREAARVARRVRGALLARDGREAREHRRPQPALEEARLGELADVLGRLEESVGAGALRVDDPLGHPLPVEVLHLLNDVVIVQGGRPLRADGQRPFVVGRRDTGIGGGGRTLLLAHGEPPRGSLACPLRLPALSQSKVRVLSIFWDKTTSSSPAIPAATSSQRAAGSATSIASTRIGTSRATPSTRS